MSVSNFVMFKNAIASSSFEGLNNQKINQQIKLELEKGKTSQQIVNETINALKNNHKDYLKQFN